MTTVYQQMVAQQHHEREHGHDVIHWQIHTDKFPAVEAEAREAGELDDEAHTILGVPFEVADRVQTDDGYLATITERRD